MISRRSALIGAGVSAMALAVPATAAEDNTANKATAQRYIDEVLNNGNTAILAEIVSPDYVSPNPDDAPGIDAYKARLDSKLQTDSYLLKHIKYSADDIAVKSPNVFVRGYVTGTSTQGKAIKALYFIEFAFKDGLIVTDWLLRDETAVMGF